MPQEIGIHDKHLSNEEMISEFDELARVENEVEKTRKKLHRGLGRVGTGGGYVDAKKFTGPLPP